jgi:PhnB protein
MKLHPYLSFDGNGKEAFHFYEQHLGGKITAMMTHAESPGDSVLMASDIPLDRQQPMRSVYLSSGNQSAREAGVAGHVEWTD